MIVSIYRYGVELAYALLTTCFFWHNEMQCARSHKARVRIMEKVSGGDCPLTDEHFGLSFGTPVGTSFTSQGTLSSEAMDILKAPYGEILQRFSVRHRNT